MKKCNKCFKDKDLNNFYKDKVRKSGYEATCKECIRKRMKLYISNNKEKSLNNKKKYLKKDYGLPMRYFGIVNRCNGKNCTNYKNYGGRGIKCEWISYQDFRKDMYDSYVKHLEEFGHKQTSIDRINNDGNYCKENCRWATNREQRLNQRTPLKKPKIKVWNSYMCITYPIYRGKYL